MIKIPLRVGSGHRTTVHPIPRTRIFSASPVYSTSWSPDSDQVLYTSGKSLVIKPLQPSAKPTHWKAHDGVILAVDWSTANNTIVSGGEDRKYKLWDCYGRCLYSSLLHDSPIASLSWSPDGQFFLILVFYTSPFPLMHTVCACLHSGSRFAFVMCCRFEPLPAELPW